MTDVTVFIGPVIHSEKPDEIKCFNKAAIAVQNGKIINLSKDGDVSKLSEIDLKNANIRFLEKGQFLCPGFLDLHIHAPQYPNIGLGYDKPLLDWLKSYTLPLEMKYEDLNFAEKVYESVVKSTLRSGTTTACYYGTIHTDSTIKLAEIASQLGQRAIVGKVNMNQNSIPKYIESTEDSLKETERFIKNVKKINNPLVEPAITPRFAISCDLELMKGLGKLASKNDLYIQTHICETKHEISYTEKLFPEFKNYTDVYQQSGLLTKKTILGHGIYLDKDDYNVLCLNGSSIAHCASSNTVLRSGLCPARDIWDAGVKIGLGTDVSGGCSISMLDAMRSALTTSIHVSFSRPNYRPLTYHEVFYLATLGGAKALSKEDIIGNFEVGKSFDAIIVDMNRELSIGVFSNNIIELFQKFIYCGDDRYIKEVFVNGKLVEKK